MNLIRIILSKLGTTKLNTDRSLLSLIRREKKRMRKRKRKRKRKIRSLRFIIAQVPIIKEHHL
jgi:hypothetical protein